MFPNIPANDVQDWIIIRDYALTLLHKLYFMRSYSKIMGSLLIPPVIRQMDSDANSFSGIPVSMVF